MWHLPQKKTQSIEYSALAFQACDELALFSNAQGCKPKSRGGYARQLALVGLAHIKAISYQTRLRIGLFPKKAEVASLEFLQERIVNQRRRCGIRDDRRVNSFAPESRQCRQNTQVCKRGPTTASRD